MTHSISPYLNNALQIQPQKLVQITSNSYATELQNKIRFLFSPLINGWLQNKQTSDKFKTIKIYLQNSFVSITFPELQLNKPN